SPRAGAPPCPPRENARDPSGCSKCRTLRSPDSPALAGLGGLSDEATHDLLELACVLVVEALELRAVHVEYANQLLRLVEHRHHDLGARARVARDVTGKVVHVPDHHRLAALGGRAAHAAADRDPETAERALVGSHHELARALGIDE